MKQSKMRIFDPITHEQLYLEASEIRRFLHSAQCIYRGTPRYYALCALYASTALRASEATTLRFSDFRLADETPTVTVRTLKQHNPINKTYDYDRHRTISLPEPVRLALLQGCMWTPDTPDQLMFPSIRDPRQPIHRSYVWRLVKDAMAAAGIPPNAKRASIKGLRHGFAMHVMETGVMSHYQLQDVLGHSSPDTTKIYTTPTPKTQAKMLLPVLDNILG